MSKELEALGQFRVMIGSLSLESIEIIEQALTPPTAEQVCEALNNFLYPLDYDGNPQFYYNKKRKTFECTNGWEIELTIYGGVRFDFLDMPPNLIELIGLFYKGVKE